MHNVSGSSPKVLVVRLLSGDEVIGKVFQTPTGITISKPVGIAMVQQKPGGDPSLAFVPFIPMSAEDKIELSFTAVLFMYPPVAEVLNIYNQRFGSGIITAPTPSLKLVQ